MKNNFIPMKKTDTNVDLDRLTLEEKIAALDGKVTPEEYGELKGLLAAHRIAPSSALLEAIIAKLIVIISKSDTKEADVYNEEDGGLDLDSEWVLAFECFLEFRNRKKSSIDVYIRSIKRIMKEYGISSAIELRNRIQELIRIYDGNDQKSHNLNTSALKQFRDFCDSKCGIITTYIDKNGGEYVVERSFCTPDKALPGFDCMIEEYRDCAVKVRMINPFGEEICSRNV